MSNILIIKHGSLGDLIQSIGAIEDIKNSNIDSKVYLLTSFQYADLMSHCPFIDAILIDKRKPRWNIPYLLNLKKNLLRFNFSHVFDLQNSSRTIFYKKFILNKPIWSSTYTALKDGQKKSDFDKDPVLDRLQVQLNRSGVDTKNIKKINLSWSFINISRLLKQYTSNDYILIFPFCSKKHQNKRWPYFKELINKLKQIYKLNYSIIIAPGPNEIAESKKFSAKVILDNEKALNLNQLISLINGAKYIVSNDTGPAHICSHLNKNGLALFGSHTSSKKVNIGNSNFKVLSEKKLSNLDINTVISKIEKELN
jgi:ADP-heptose:LPS heptosyltransferase